jgi:signal transduction histidine kinase
VKTGNNPLARVGDWVEVIGFPEAGGLSSTLTEALVRVVAAGVPLKPQKVNLSDAVADSYDGTLIRLEAILLAQKTSQTSQLLELQQGQRIFEAMLAQSHGELPSFATGSLLEITGACDAGLVSRPVVVKASDENILLAPVQIRMRSPLDVVLLKGPPKWTWKEVAVLISGLLILLTGALLRIYLSRRRLEQQQAAQFAFSRQILQGQESERRRIAANLHDSLGQSLLIIKNQAWLAMQPVTDESVRRRLDEISAVTSQAIEEVRQITHDLRPYQLDKLGLTQSIRAIIKRVSETSSIRFENDVEDIDGLFSQESEIHVYRIVQECLNNVVKHSGATQATLAVKRQLAGVSISIQDNGRGFEAGLINSTGLHDTGFGLSGIGERARILGGKLTVDSRLGQGAHLLVIIPMSKPKA